MIIKRRGLNPNETYCCTIRDVKQVFGKADIQVYFGYNICRKEKDNRKYYQSNKKFDEILVASMSLFNSTFYNEMYWIMHFFILEKKEYNENAYNKFIKEALPKLYKLYEQHKEDNPYEKGAYSVVVGYDGERFNFFDETDYKWLD